MTSRAQRTCAWSWVAAAMVVAAACARPEPDTQQPEPLRIVGPGEAIDSRGGTTERQVAGWPVRVSVPAGAVSSPFALDIRTVDAEPGVLFAADFTPSPFQFETPIEVAFDECAVQGLPYALPVAAHAATKVNGVWVPLPTERRGPCELVAKVSHFSIIGLLPDGEYAEAFEQVGSFFDVGCASGAKHRIRATHQRAQTKRSAACVERAHG